MERVVLLTVSDPELGHALSQAFAKVQQPPDAKQLYSSLWGIVPDRGGHTPNILDPEQARVFEFLYPNSHQGDLKEKAVEGMWEDCTLTLALNDPGTS
jgi:hypothetical protein